MMKLQSINSEYQRRPTRIFTENTNSPSGTLNSSSIKSRLATSNNNTSRLKCSTITKVPPANKSRLKQHIVKNIQTNSNSTQTQNDPDQSKFLSKLAKPTAIRVRPTSLALKSPQDQQSSRKIPTKLCTTSTLPKLQTNLGANDVSCIETDNNCTKTSPRFSSSSESTINTKSLSLSGVRTQDLFKRKTSIIRQGIQTISTSSKNSGSRLSGLKNLVAVVHPQHSQQRVNSSATTTTSSVNKFCSQTITTTQTTTTTSKLSLPSCSNTKIGSGKLDSNHKDVNGKGREERRECKQNEFNVAFDRQQRQQLKTKSNVPPAHQFSNGFTLNPTAKTSSSTISTYMTSANTQHKNGQFKHGNNSSDHLLSVASNAYDYDDKKQHGNSKQSSNHLSIRNIHPTSIISQADECKNENNWQTSNCYSHESADLTLAKSPLIHSKNNTNIAHSINNYILPKPMGQQVLSLMMLDVGLMPSNNNQPHQPVQSSKRSHVCLPSLSRRNFVNDSCVDSFSNDQTSIDNHEYLCTTSYDNIFGRNHTNYKQCKDYHSLQPTTDGMFNLQLEMPNLNSRNLKSISLPSSPSISAKCLRKLDRTHIEASNSFKAADFNCQLNHFLRHEIPTIRGPSPATSDSERSRKTDRLLTFYDSQDSHSITSSSCSSLKQCPPLLALSNQLEGFKLDELVKANTETAHKSGTERLTGSKSEMNYDKTQFPDQTSLVLEQHKLLINNPNNQIGKNQLSERGRDEDCSDQIERSLENGLSSRQQVACELKQCSETQVNKQLCEDDCSDHQLRRQQQPRSHSIGGQEFYSNGSYGRLKQSLYSPKNVQELNQSYNSQTGNRIHQTPSLFQPQQLPGRSPSPSSISGHINYGSSPHDISFKHSLGRPVRNHLHASLECLNPGYSDYQSQLVSNNNNQQLQQHHINQQNSQYPQQQNYHVQNQHYAASYLPVPPPANTIINQNADQDLAAAAISNPVPYYQQKSHPTAMSTYSYQTQNLINRAMNQVSQSPMRRVGLNNSVSNGIPAGMFSHLTSSHNPMRAGHSSLSLASSSFLIEDKLQNEIKKLQSELKSEKEKAEALNSQLNINSSLMAAFEQSLTTLNTRLRQLTTLNEKKEKEIEDLRDQLNRTKLECYVEQQVSSEIVSPSSSDNTEKQAIISEKDNSSEQSLIKVIEDLRRQLIEKDRILTDTRLEALSSAHQLEQLESKLNGEHSLLVNEDDLDEGVMVVNHSPSDSDAITDSTQFNEINSKFNNSDKHKRNSDNLTFRQTNYPNSSNNPNENTNNITDSSPENNYTDNQSNHSSNCSIDMRDRKQHNLNTSVSQQFNNGSDSGLVGIE